MLLSKICPEIKDVIYFALFFLKVERFINDDIQFRQTVHLADNT